MKVKFLKGILTAVASTFLFSCSSSDGNEFSQSPSKETTIPVSIGFTGEVLNVSELPLARANASKDWYYFQVYSKPEDEQYDNYTYYAYGFFDNKNDMVINLKSGYKYKFDVGMCLKAEEKVRYFSLVNSGWARIGNTFMVSSSEHVRYMYQGYLYMADDQYDRPDIDRFFGEVKDYTPKEGGTVEINMKRVSFGAKFVAKNFDSGSLEINVEGAPTINLTATDGSEVEKIISFDRVEAAYLAEGEYSESIPVNIVWVKTDNTRVPIANQNVAFKRNKLMVVEFEVKENTSGNSIDIKANETIEKGETVTIGGDGTNTEVNPNT